MERKITIRPRSELTAEQARSARANAWRYDFECYARKNAALASRSDDGKEKDARAAPRMPE